MKLRLVTTEREEGALYDPCRIGTLFECKVRPINMRERRPVCSGMFF